MKRLTTWLLLASLTLGLCACGEAPVEQTEAPTEPVIQVPAEIPEEELVTETVIEGSLDELSGITYNVVVVDQNENPVPGVQIRLESEEGTLCETDEMGVATYTLPIGQYSVSIVYMPEGFGYSNEVRTFSFAENANYLTIVLYSSDIVLEEEELEELPPVDEGYEQAEEFLPEE